MPYTQSQAYAGKGSTISHSDDATPTPVWTSIWVSIEQLGGTERVVAQQIFADASTRLWMKFQAGILPKMRVTYTDGESVTRHLDILSVADPSGRRRFLQLLCTERVESGS